MVNNTEKLMVNPYLKVIQINSNEVLIKHSGNSIYSKLLEDEAQKGIVGEVFTAFKSQMSIEEFINKYRSGSMDEETMDFINYCVDNNLIIKESDDIICTYYRMITKNGNIGNPLIGIIGVGSLGSKVLKNLYKLGITRFAVLDERNVKNEKVEEKFLEYSSVKCGEKYVELAKKDYEGIVNTYDELTDENLKKIIDLSDFVVCTQDCLKSTLFHKINMICIEKNKSWVLAYIDGSEGFLGPTFIPGDTCCFNEVEIQNDATLPDAMRRDYSLYKEYLNDNVQVNDIYILPTYTEILAGMLSTEIFKFIYMRKTVLFNYVIKIDMETMDFDSIKILKLPRCPACDKHEGFKNMFL